MKDDAKGKHLQHVPGENGLPVLGNVFKMLRDPKSFDKRMLETYGKCFRSRVFGRTAIFLGDAEHNTTVLLDREQNYSSKCGWGHLLEGLFSDGLLLRDFEDHRKQRRIMQHAFRPKALKGYHEILQERTLIQIEQWASLGAFPLFSTLKQALLEQAATVFLGASLGDEVEMLSQAFHQMNDAVIAPVRANIPGTALHRGIQGRKTLEAFMYRELESRRGSNGNDVFSMLCKAEDEEGNRFRDSEIVDHMIFLLMAAHETTTVALTTLVQELIFNPGWQDKLREECLELATGKPELPWDWLPQLKLIDWAFREVLRMNPPTRYVVRRTVEASEVAGYLLPARTPVSLVVDASHQDPNLWTEPEVFDPMRFSPQRAEHKNHKHAWIPFGGGAHSCIGMKFSIQQAKMFLYHLLVRYEIESTESEKPEWQLLPFPHPKNGLPIVLKPLQGSAESHTLG